MFDLYVLCQENRIIVSYGKKAENRLDGLKMVVNNRKSPEEMKKVVEEIYGGQAGHGIKYAFKAGTEIMQEAKVMALEDYAYYEDFFVKCNPVCGDDIQWLKEYFEEMQKNHLCVGVFSDHRLVSCTDVPTMPYMEDEVQEIGINTLPEYRGHGYAAAACSKCIFEILNAGKTPLWSTSVNNTASRRLARKVGFKEFAEVIIMTL